MTIAPLLPLLMVSAVFDVRTVPLADPAAPVFVAQADADKTADIFVLNGNTVAAYTAADGNKPLTAVLPEGASGFDVYDINADGFAEVIAVCGEAIMTFRLVPPGAAPQAETLFKLQTQLSAPAVQPYPYVLVVPQPKADTDATAPALALPCENTFELRKLDGSLIASFPIASEAVHRISYGSPFRVDFVDKPQAGPAGSIEAEVSRVIAFEPELPPGLAPVVAPSLLYRREVALPQPRDTGASQSWPWFPLKTDGATSLRALYALAGPDFGDSVVCVRRSDSEGVDLSGKSVVVGPERRYPGMLCVNGEDLPDFDGDGYVDMLLWQAPAPGMSLDSLARVFLGHRWKLDLIVHLFNPQKNRFQPRPAAHLALDAPPNWLANTAPACPLRHMVFRDFDGDGRTDLGASTAPNRWAAWLFKENGFSPRPDFDKLFDEPIERIEFRANLDKGPATSLAVRTQTALYLLSPSGR